MKSSSRLLGFILITLLTLGSCGLGQAKEDAEKTVKVFHHHMKEHHHAAMLKMIDKEAFQITPEEEWLGIFTSIDELGKMKKVSQDMSFSTNINNGVTIVELNYTVEFEERTVTEKITLRKRGDEYKIQGYFIQ